MAEFKFNIGDKVILDYPDYPEYNRSVCTIRGRERLFDDRNSYLVEEYSGFFDENHLIPYAQPEELVPVVSLKTLFGGDGS